MKKILYILTILLTIYACQNDDVGYLATSRAGYTVDTLLVKTVLDTSKTVNPQYELYLSFGFTPAQLASFGIDQYFYGDDYFRMVKDMPWTSLPIEGVEGTSPMFMSLAGVKTQSGDINSFKQYADVRGDGRIQIPFQHEIAPGRYLISIDIKNEGYQQTVEDVFTVIVQEPLVEE